MVSILSTPVLGTMLDGSVFFSSTVIFCEPMMTQQNNLDEGFVTLHDPVLSVSPHTVESLWVESPS